MSRREVEGSIQTHAVPQHRALRNEGGWTIQTPDHPVGDAAPLVLAAGVQVAAVPRLQKDRQDQVLGTEKDGKPSLKGWGGVGQKIAVVQTRITAIESTVFALINH